MSFVVASVDCDAIVQSLVGKHMSYLKTVAAFFFCSICSLLSSIMAVPVSRRPFVTSIISWSAAEVSAGKMWHHLRVKQSSSLEGK